MCYDRERVEEELKDFPEIMTYAEAMSAFKIRSYKTLRRKIDEGHIVTVNHLGSTRVSKSATINKIECEQLK